MAKARRQKTSPRSKSASHSRPRRHAATAADHPRASLLEPAADAVVEATTAPLSVVADEMQSFGKRRLDKLMQASSRLLAVRDVADVTVIQSEFFFGAMEDYADEAWRMIDIWMRALGQGYRPLERLGEKAARELPLAAMPSQTMADIAKSSAIVN